MKKQHLGMGLLTLAVLGLSYTLHLQQGTIDAQQVSLDIHRKALETQGQSILDLLDRTPAPSTRTITIGAGQTATIDTDGVIRVTLPARGSAQGTDLTREWHAVVSAMRSDGPGVTNTGGYSYYPIHDPSCQVHRQQEPPPSQVRQEGEAGQRVLTFNAETQVWTIPGSGSGGASQQEGFAATQTLAGTATVQRLAHD